MKKNKIFIMGLALTLGAGAALTSCVDTDSTLVDFDPQLSSPNDTVYSLLGVLKKMQTIADRTVILGDLKGELTAVTEDATTDLQEVANFTATTENVYNAPEDYYAVIQNCNYYIAHADTNLSLRGEKVFIREYAAVKAFRAWTYLQLAIHYGKVPFYTKPLLTEAEADPSLYPKYDVRQICEYFIPDLAPYVETDVPLGASYTDRFLPVRVLLGDLCLWAGRYREAAQYYHDYLTHNDNPQPPVPSEIEYRWSSYEFKGFTTSSYGGALLAYNQMESLEYDGTVSYLDDIYISTDDNRYYYQATASQALSELSASQHFTLVYTDPTTNLPDTVYPAENQVYQDSRMKGDLRFYSKVSSGYSAGTDGYSRYTQSMQLLSATAIPYYYLSDVYLRMAEAYNRAGLPQSAFAILKYGLSTQTVSRYVSQEERDRAGSLLTWSQYDFITQGMTTGTVNTRGIHSYGCGDAYADTLYYVMPELPSEEDSILYVEDLICNEMALEGSFNFTGQRFADLQRIALRRDDNSFLARKVAGRNGEDNFDTELYNRLLDRNNWYLPLE